MGRTICAPGKVQITRPYLSVIGPKLCVTLSFAFEGVGDNDDDEDDYANGAGSDIIHGTYYIVWKKTFKVVPPAPGYKLDQDC